MTGWKTNATKQNWYPNTTKGSLISASNKLEHSPLNNVRDVSENPVVRTAREGTKHGDEAHQHSGDDNANEGG